VIPTDPSSKQVRYCHLRSDYLHNPHLRGRATYPRGGISPCQSTSLPSLAHSVAHLFATSSVRARVACALPPR
jgi:hypothetical protein